MSGPTFQVMPPLSDADYTALKWDIAEHGVLVPVEYDDGGNILDGHHRVRACRELGIAHWPRIVRHHMTEPEKRRHARALNLTRRHLSSEQKRELIADQLRDTPERSDRQVAEGLGVDHKTVGSIRSDLHTTGEIPQLPTRVGQDGKERRLPAPRRTYTFTGDGDPKLIVTKHTGNFEWHTPCEYIDAARRVLGEIDLDPASSEIAQQTVRAATYLTRENDGLAQHWRGRVWLNPPYAADLIGIFVRKLVEHVLAGDVRAAIMLVDNRSDTAWFHEAWAACSSICFTRGRIQFVRPSGEQPGSPTNGSAFFYFGPDVDTFEGVFGGSTWRPSRRSA